MNKDYVIFFRNAEKEILKKYKAPDASRNKRGAVMTVSHARQIKRIFAREKCTPQQAVDRYIERNFTAPQS